MTTSKRTSAAGRLLRVVTISKLEAIQIHDCLDQVLLEPSQPTPPNTTIFLLS